MEHKGNNAIGQRVTTKGGQRPAGRGSETDVRIPGPSHSGLDVGSPKRVIVGAGRPRRMASRTWATCQYPRCVFRYDRRGKIRPQAALRGCHHPNPPTGDALAKPAADTQTVLNDLSTVSGTAFMSPPMVRVVQVTLLAERAAVFSGIGPGRENPRLRVDPNSLSAADALLGHDDVVAPGRKV